MYFLIVNKNDGSVEIRELETAQFNRVIDVIYNPIQYFGVECRVLTYGTDRKTVIDPALVVEDAVNYVLGKEDCR